MKPEAQVKKADLFNRIMFGEIASSSYGRSNREVGKNFFARLEDSLPTDAAIHETLRTGKITDEALERVDRVVLTTGKGWGNYNLRAIHEYNYDVVLVENIDKQQGIELIAEFDQICLDDIEAIRKEHKNNASKKDKGLVT